MSSLSAPRRSPRKRAGALGSETLSQMAASSQIGESQIPALPSSTQGAPPPTPGEPTPSDTPQNRQESLRQVVAEPPTAPPHQQVDVSRSQSPEQMTAAMHPSYAFNSLAHPPLSSHEYQASLAFSHYANAMQPHVWPYGMQAYHPSALPAPPLYAHSAYAQRGGFPLPSGQAPNAASSPAVEQPSIPAPAFGVNPARLAAPPTFPATTAPSSTRSGQSGVDLARLGLPATVESVGTSSQDAPSFLPSSAEDTSTTPTSNPPQQTSSASSLAPTATQNEISSNTAQQPSSGNASSTPLPTTAPEESDHGSSTESDEGLSDASRSRAKRRKGKGKSRQSYKAKRNQKLDELKKEARANGYDPEKAASGANPFAGWVEGAGMGESEAKIYRKNFLMPPIMEQAESTRSYRRWLIDIFSKAEVISRRTGCWFYMAAQHPNANTPFHYYASPKLRREAPDAVQDFHGKVSLTMRALMTAEKGSKVSLADEAMEAKKKLQATEEALASRERQIEELQSRLANLERLQQL